MLLSDCGLGNPVLFNVKTSKRTLNFNQGLGLGSGVASHLAGPVLVATVRAESLSYLVS